MILLNDCPEKQTFELRSEENYYLKKFKFQ